MSNKLSCTHLVTLLFAASLASTTASAQLKDSSGLSNTFQGNVGIGTTTPAVTLDDSTSTDAIALPAGTTAQRPTAANGILRFNTTTGLLEAYYNSTWNNLSAGISGGGTGTTTAFTQGSVVFAGAGGVYTQDNANIFWDAANHRLGLGTAAPSVGLDLSARTDAIQLPSGTTANRPASPVAGMLRYNTTTGSVETYKGTTPTWGRLRGVVARFGVTGQTASIAPTTLFTATNAGSYLICMHVIIDVGGGAVSSVQYFTVSSFDVYPSYSWSMATINGNNPGTNSTCISPNIAAGTTIAYKTTVGTVGGAPTYSLYGRVYELY